MQLDKDKDKDNVDKCIAYIQGNVNDEIPYNFINASGEEKVKLLSVVMHPRNNKSVEHFRKIIKLFSAISDSPDILLALRNNLGLFVFCPYLNSDIGATILSKIARMKMEDKTELQKTCVDLCYPQRSQWVSMFLLEYKIEKMLSTLAADNTFCQEIKNSFHNYLTTRNLDNLQQACTHVADAKVVVVDFPKKELGWFYPFFRKNTTLRSMLVKLDRALCPLLSAHQISYEDQKHKEVVV